MPELNDDKTFFHDVLLEILRETSPDKPMQKKKMIELLARKSIHSARSTLDKKLADLENKGYRIINTGRRGYYLERDNSMLSDGELRFLIDSIMYSRIIPEDNASVIIEKLAKFGSGMFEKEMNKRAVSAKNLEKDTYWGTIDNVEVIQKAILDCRQISCNYINVIDYELEYKYEDDIVVNPYELAFSGGKYYLLCSFENSDELIVLRVDRLDHLEILKTNCAENKSLEKIRKEKGIQQYLYNQPELRGGQPVDVDLLCYSDAVNLVYDDFGKMNTRIKTIRPLYYNDPDTTLISVRTTREAIKAWALFHADSIVVISPQELRDEITEAMEIARHTYKKTGKPPQLRSMMARSFKEALHEIQSTGGKCVRYMGHSKTNEIEVIDVGRYDIEGIGKLVLSHCGVCVNEKTVFPDVTKLILNHCDFSFELFTHFPNLKFITISDGEFKDLEFLKNYPELHELCLFDCSHIKDYSALFELKSLKKFETNEEYIDKDTVQNINSKYPDCVVRIWERNVGQKREEGPVAERAVYYIDNGKIVSKTMSFDWFAGFSLSQKQKSIASLHNAIKKDDESANPLEISTKSQEELGKNLSAFRLHCGKYHLENVFQSSKVFERGGPYRDLLTVLPGEGKSDVRLKESGEIIGFNYDGNDFPTEPKTLFYDYIYIKAVKQSLSSDEIKRIAEFTHFTDIEFNPKKSINTQAKSVAIIKLMLERFGEIPEMNVDEFIEFHNENVKA